MPPPPDALTPIRIGGEPWPAPAEAEAAARPAAVLVLVAPTGAGEASVVLIERQSYDGHHSGEIAFPGGTAEDGDADAEATALREAAEEIGLEPSRVGLRVVGVLEPFWIPVSNFSVTPVLAIAERLQSWRRDPREVARVIEAPLERFLPGAPITTFERDVLDWRIRYGAYSLVGVSGGSAGPAGPAGPAVWGATARILGQLGAIIGPD